MADRFDVVVAGAGHNNPAAYLAKAGFRCLMLESQAGRGVMPLP